MTLSINTVKSAIRNEFIEITHYEQLAPFAGKLIALTTKPNSSHRFRGNDENPVYGILGDIPQEWRDGSTGYSLSLLYRKEQVQSQNVLVNKNDRKEWEVGADLDAFKNSVGIRLITDEEKIKKLSLLK